MNHTRAWIGVASILMLFWSICCSPASSPPEQARNVILFIGDGMGPAHLGLGVSYGLVMEERDLALTKLMKLGMTGYTLNLSHDTMVIDSAASATQMATGGFSRTEMLGMDPDGYPVETILEWAEGRDFATGLVTNTRLTHATPAAFVAHKISRYEPEPDIADAMLDGLEIEVLMGGGARAFIPKGTKVSETLKGVLT